MSSKQAQTVQDALRAAIQLAGGQVLLGEAIKASQPQISQWMTGVRPVPPKKAAAIESFTKGAVSRRALRPDDWDQLWPELAA